MLILFCSFETAFEQRSFLTISGGLPFPRIFLDLEKAGFSSSWGNVYSKKSPSFWHIVYLSRISIITPVASKILDGDLDLSLSVLCLLPTSHILSLGLWDGLSGGFEVPAQSSNGGILDMTFYSTICHILVGWRRLVWEVLMAFLYFIFSTTREASGKCVYVRYLICLLL